MKAKRTSFAGRSCTTRMYGAIYGNLLNCAAEANRVIYVIEYL